MTVNRTPLHRRPKDIGDAFVIPPFRPAASGKDFLIPPTVQSDFERW